MGPGESDACPQRDTEPLCWCGKTSLPPCDLVLVAPESCVRSRTPIPLTAVPCWPSPWPGFWGNALRCSPVLPSLHDAARWHWTLPNCPLSPSPEKLLTGRHCVSSLESCKFSPFLYIALPSSATHSRIRGVLWERTFLGANQRHSPYVSPASRCHVFLWKVKLSSLESLSSRKLTRLWFNSMSHSWNWCFMGFWPNKLSFFWSRVNLS